MNVKDDDSETALDDTARDEQDLHTKTDRYKTDQPRDARRHVQRVANNGGRSSY